ncbi:choice-of-anchor D domain-containing protein [Flavobacterium sp. DSP2-3-1]|uniref:choice-of-anchor D domain-containing protein n=1 Tax=Flavobacterium sp. DSP2-3-1 TaxID=2804620 RepID=UPI003CF6BF74
MDKHYFTKITTCLKFSTNHNVNNDSIISRNQQSNSCPISLFLELSGILFSKGSKVKSIFYTKTRLLTLAFLFVSFLGFAQSTQTFNNPANNGLAANVFTVPAGVTSIDIEAWGAGGAGGGAAGTNSSGGGGAGGGYAKKTSFIVVPGATYNVTVGAGGVGTRYSIVPGAASLLSSGATTHLLAVGGNGAAHAANNNTYTIGATAGTSGNTGFSAAFSYYGGKGGDGVTLNGFAGGGGGGSSAGKDSNGNGGINQTGGAAVIGGGKGADGSDVSGNGANGLIPGGGGAGANALTTTDQTGGSGANGRVIISWPCPIFSLTSTTIASPSCSTFPATVNVNGTAVGLPVGSYTVTYNLSGANTGTGSKATIVVSTAGTGSFSTNSLTNVGSTTITITNLAKLTCNNAIILNNTANTIIAATPSISSAPDVSRTGNGSVTLVAASATGGANFSWYATMTGGTALSTAASYNTPTLTTTTTYYVEVSKSSCNSSPRFEVDAIINNPEIAVSGNGTSISDDDITPSTADFTNVGTTNLLVELTRTYTINNLGAAPLNLTSIIIGGTNASEFVVTNPPTSIAAQSSATFTITFKPTITGARNATLTFDTDDADENPFNFSISGTATPGLTPEINLRATNDIPDGASSGKSVDGTVIYGTDFGAPLINTDVLKTFTIQNTGTGVLTLSGTPIVMLSGDAVFTVTAQPTSGTIAAGSSLTFQVKFNSAITGNFLAIVSIANNDNDESIYDFVITAGATVAGREIDIQGNDVTIVDGDTTPSSLDQTNFGITDPTTKIAIPFQIYNYGDAALGLTTAVSITGSNATFFAASAIPVSSLPAGITGVTSFVITFNPTAAVGIKTAIITVTNTDNAGVPSETSYDFAVSAEIKNSVALTVAPGGVTTNLKYWIKADSNIGSVADNVAMSTWQENTTGSTKNAIAKLGKEPKFLHNTTNNVNFNPVIYFNGANAMAGGQGFNNLDMFMVIKPKNTVNYLSSPMDTYCGDDITVNKGSQDVTGFEMGNTSSRYGVGQEVLAYNQAANTSYGTGEISNTKSYKGVNIFNPRFNGTRMSILNNANLLTTTEVNTSTYKNILNSRYWLGASEAFGPSYNGDFLEVINYSAANTATDKGRIESYLAIKYGITLGINGTSVDYYNSGSTNTATAIYPAGITGAFYNFNIAGIGRDDVSQLYQKQSKTENTADDITIGLGSIYDKNSDNPNTFVGDKNYLVWGNNNGTLLKKPAVVVNISSGIAGLTSNVEFISVGRTWRVIETGGNVPSCKVSLPSTLLTSTITPPGNFLMFISSTPQFNPTSEYRIMRVNGSKLETDYDFDGTKYITFGYAPERTFERAIDFDGVNDYLDSGKVLDINSSFTVSAWIKSSAVNQTILSKRNNPFTAGYDLSINASGKVEMSWYNGIKQSIISSIVMPSERWHNVCVVYDNATLTAKLYIDGIEDASKILINIPLNPSQSFLIAAADGVTPTSFFDGSIDEVRVWDVALSEKQLRYIMNQEIISNGLNTNGSVVLNTIPNNDISSIPWANLKAYYPMSTYTFTNAKDISNNNFTAALRNLTTVNLQTAPLPYTSKADGAWQTTSTWNNSVVQDLPYSLSIVDDSQTIDWNIVKTTHNIISDGDKKVLGLYVDVGTTSTLKASNDSKIEVSHYLKLDGTIDLIGKSQLVQSEGSFLDPTSAGSIERDQQGQANKYNYNYWSSPVGTINTTTNNNNFTVAGVLRDGTTATPQSITWVSGYDGSLSPFSLARYWIYKFDNKANAYANWTQIGETGLLEAGKGFTLKGAGTSGLQNLNFVGKPNNGTIANTVSANQLLLVGNPYPSALDATAFITDNSGSIDITIPTATDGALYFWEHYPGNNTHNLGGYQGGYGVRNAAAGVAPSSVGVDFINTSGVSNRALPNRYIPVGQGFFVIGNATGGTVTFKNSQRAFVKEDNAASQIIYRIPTQPKKLDHWTDNSDDPVAKDTYKRVRLGFNNYNEIFHRQVVVAFMDDKANGEINEGYDAENIDDVDNDMYLINSEKKLMIEGEGYFDETSSYPIGVRSDSIGKISFVLDDLENFDDNQKVFIYDKSDETYHNIKDTLYEVELPKGTFNDRFYLRFTDKTLGSDSFNLSKSDGVIVVVNQNVTVQSSNQLIKNIVVYDLLGRKIDGYKKVNAKKYTLSHLNKTTAGLIVKITLDNDTVVSKKIIY